MLYKDGTTYLCDSKPWTCSGPDLGLILQDLHALYDLRDVDVPAFIEDIGYRPPSRPVGEYALVMAGGPLSDGLEEMLVTDYARRNVRERWPVVRTSATEDRVPIDGWVRRAIYDRDGRTCTLCGNPEHSIRATGSYLQLDHIVPWSAGGADTAANLRTVCSLCNTQRSNLRDLAEEDRPRLPVTFSCLDCDAYEIVADAEPVAGVDLVLAYCGCCGGITWEEPDRIR